MSTTTTATRGLRGPLADSYPAAVALVVLALVPYLALTSSLQPLIASIGKELHLSRGALELATSMGNGAYAFGTVLAVQFAQHLRPRRMLVLYVSLFVICTALAAWAPTPGVFVGALVTEGLCTSLMLIAAVPPLVTGYGPSTMPWTGTIMNLCIFGAVAAGPTIGTALAAAKDWRVLFVVVSVLAVLALVFALLTYEDEDPQDTTAPWDVVAILLAAVGCGAAFFGAAEVEVHRSATVEGVAPLAVGLALIVALVAYQFRREEPLMPVRDLATTLPTTGILVAICASAGAFGLTELALTALKARSPGHVAVLFLPELGAAVVTAALFGLLFRTRFTPVLAGVGLVLICAAAAVVAGVSKGGDGRALLGAALVGLGVGACVSPALFIAGFSLSSARIQRVFALIELLRGVAAFLFAPILLTLAASLGSTKSAGLADAAWICGGIAATGLIGGIALFLLGGARLQRPDLEAFADGEPAWGSPPLLAQIRR